MEDQTPVTDQIVDIVALEDLIPDEPAVDETGLLGIAILEEYVTFDIVLTLLESMP